MLERELVERAEALRRLAGKVTHEQVRASILRTIGQVEARVAELAAARKGRKGKGKSVRRPDEALMSQIH
jgi:hypothetical protein